MNGCPRGADCGGCQMYGGPMVCHCLQVTEDQLVSALTTLELRTVREVRRLTGAGDGCTACHRKIQKYIDTYSSSPEICSAR
jgi:bacterioferritin-associated ferredoxin